MKIIWQVDGGVTGIPGKNSRRFPMQESGGLLFYGVANFQFACF